ncbi:MAG: hypothetical protein JRC86_12875, partial [Deltaproteobacteria bacterium]|nr:hypothetical protein [Deltaproteobacteria bacterium]
KEGKQAQLLEKLGVLYGRAEAEVDTYQGAIGQLQNSYSDLKEDIGEAVTESEDFRDVLIFIKDTIDDLNKSGQMSAWIRDIGAAMKAALDYSVAGNQLKVMAAYFRTQAIEADRLNDKAETLTYTVNLLGEGFKYLGFDIKGVFPFLSDSLEDTAKAGKKVDKLTFKKPIKGVEEIVDITKEAKNQFAEFPVQRHRCHCRTVVYQPHDSD